MLYSHSDTLFGSALVNFFKFADESEDDIMTTSDDFALFLLAQFNAQWSQGLSG